MRSSAPDATIGSGCDDGPSATMRRPEEQTMDSTPHPLPAPTGRREDRASGTAIVLDRRFDATAAEVWAALTEPGQLERWIGTWSGDPASGAVVFRMTAEGDHVDPEPTVILACIPRERLALSIGTDGSEAPEATDGTADADSTGAWRLDLTLTNDGPATELTFAQLLDDPTAVGDIAPGWEYYLDRLTAVLRGTDVSAIRFTDYHPAQSAHYRTLFS
jgi:uncharacterized protein YndB with AHSA1/START domain